MDEIVMNNNQVHSWGGKREGAGRPVGSTNKERISDYLKDKDKEALFQKAFELATAGNDKLLQFFLEQLFGKPRQNLGLDGGEDGEAIRVIFDDAFRTYAASSGAKASGGSAE